MTDNIGKEQAELPPPRMGVAFSVEGEARFLSHHDMMRLMAHAVGRAQLPVQYSAGFNPRAKLSLALPRPVGVASRADLLVIRFTRPVAPDDLSGRLAAQMPEGITITGVRELVGTRSLQPESAEYELAADPQDTDSLVQQLAHLHDQPCWPCHRPERRGKSPQRDLDLRTLVRDLDFDGHTLRFMLVGADGIWARIGEVLELVGLDRPQLRCRVVRAAVQWASLTVKPQSASKE